MSYRSFLDTFRNGTVARWWRSLADREYAMERTVSMPTRVPLYALHGRNSCPSCGASQWFVGRIIAECACCGDTLPINHAVRPTQMTKLRDIAA